jgi:hypothetical protein
MFVANAQENCSRRRHRLVALDRSGRGYHYSHGIGEKCMMNEADHGIQNPATVQGKVTANKEKRRQIGCACSKEVMLFIRRRAVQTTAYNTSSRWEIQSEI